MVRHASELTDEQWRPIEPLLVEPQPPARGARNLRWSKG